VQIEETIARTRGDGRNATGAKDQRRREKRRTRERRDGWINPGTLRFIGLAILLSLHTETNEKRSEAEIATLLEKVETQRARKDPLD
jgi:hypothetical protein